MTTATIFIVLSNEYYVKPILIHKIAVKESYMHESILSVFPGSNDDAIAILKLLYSIC